MAEQRTDTPGASPGQAALAAGGVVTSLTAQSQRLGNSFGFSFYGPGQPLPAVVDGQPIRQWDFQPGFNLNISPRHNEPFNFAHLRAFANVELVRMAIETRKDQLESQDWMVKPRDNKAARAKERDPASLEIEKFLSKPDGVTPFPTFMRALNEDLLALDAPALECRRTRGGQLLGLELVDGATINLLVDDTGRRPRGPKDDAFQQIIRGVVWGNLTNRDLLYLPRNVRTNHIYGYGPVEQIIVTINTILRRQGSQLAYFTEGNVPAGLLTAPENWTNDQIRDLQTWFDQKLAGNIGEQRKLIWGPHGSEYKAFKDAPIKDEFDEWLARLVAYAFSLPPTPFVRQMNKGTANEDQDRALEEGLEPLKLWGKRWLDDLIAVEFGHPELEFVWREDIDLDPKTQSEIDDRNLKNGSSVIDEVRDRRGEDPLENGLGSKPMVYMGDCPIPLESLADMIALKLKPPPPPFGAGGFDENGEPIEPEPGAAGDNAPPGAKAKAPKAGDNDEDEPAEPGKEPAPGSKKKPSAGVSKAARVPPAHALALSIDRPKARKIIKRLKGKIEAIFAEAGPDLAGQIEAELGKIDEDDAAAEAARIVRTLNFSALMALEEPLFDEILELAEDSIRISLASVGVEASSELVDRVNERAVEYARERAAELVAVEGDEGLIATTREMIRQVIADGLENNIGRSEIAQAVKESQAFSSYRANLIADTEIAFANGDAKRESWAEVKADGMQLAKEWHVSGEDGVCDECEANAAEGEIPFDDEFSSGDEMEPAHPGCRCVTTARVLEEAEESGE